MRTRWTALLVSLALFLSVSFQAGAHSAQPGTTPTKPVSLPPAAVQDGITVYFSPKGGCTNAIVEQLNAAKTSIKLQAYSFTSVSIAEALRDAHRRGAKVTAVLDKSQRSETYSSATYIKNQGIATFIDSQHAIAHNKIILIDGTTIITGSFNFSKAAEESNAENLLIIRDKADLYRAYEKNFEEHLAHSSPYGGLEQAPSVQPQAPPAAKPEPASTTPSAAATPSVTLRSGITATPDEEALAKRIKVAGWEYIMPTPKSAQAAWGNHDGRTTWYDGYWKNGTTAATSSTQPKADDNFKGDGAGFRGWRRGGAPAAPSRIEWLCSTSGGIPPR